jgi:hypothetical protein
MNKKSIGSGTRSKAAFWRSQEPPLSRTRRLGHQREGFYAFCSRSHAYRGFVGCSTCLCTQVHASRTTQPPNLQPFQKASQSICTSLYASRHNRNNQFTNSKPYYHCKQNNPTAKPKAILESFAKHIHVYVCMSTQAEQPK